MALMVIVNAVQLEGLKTARGHLDDRSQPSLPVVHRSFANPAPLNFCPFQLVYASLRNLLSTLSIFLILMYGVDVRDVGTPNVLIGVSIFFGGLCQIITSVMEFATTVLSSYGAFNFSYDMIYLPSSGILASYTDPTTDMLNEQFTNALAVYIWAWLIFTVIYTVAAIPSSYWTGAAGLYAGVLTPFEIPVFRVYKLVE
ncbi:GPR1/FUN34/yaaH family-domain-containing protein [Bisporella sp. PMI_857]|nr:GPR1/FUN34/yaaH family-domain-containing protein [Bisporella sp. PMI_857]